MLNDPDRQKWLPSAAVLERLALQPGMRVADVGAGTGYFALPIAHAVNPAGQDVQVPPGPPLQHRVAASDVRAALQASGWKVGTPEPVGLFSYMILAARP